MKLMRFPSAPGVDRKMAPSVAAVGGQFHSSILNTKRKIFWEWRVVRQERSSFLVRPKSELGQSRHFHRRQAPSGLPRSTDVVRPPGMKVGAIAGLTHAGAAKGERHSIASSARAGRKFSDVELKGNPPDVILRAIDFRAPL
jgi:hypothetical protein